VTERFGDGCRTPISATNLATVMDRAQYDAGAGPCLTAADEGRSQQLDAADEQSDYPEFAAAAARLGVRSSLSLPLVGGRPAALNLYASVPAAFGGQRPRAVAELLARCMATLLYTGPVESIGSGGSAGAGADPAAMAAALARRRLMRDAEEALMVSDRLSRADAFSELLRRSKAEMRSVFGVAADLLDRVDPGPGR
jgi:hypothetical protein